MHHKEWKMGTMVERIQPVGPLNLLNNMVKVFANTTSIMASLHTIGLLATRQSQLANHTYKTIAMP